MNVLIADDQREALDHLGSALEAIGHEVEVAHDGESAWEYLRAGEASVLISDWMIPGLDGPELCRRLRAHDLGRYVYVILLTGRGGRFDRLQGLRAGADDFLTKPPDFEGLAIRLEVASRILAVHRELKLRNLEQMAQATTDGLTGLANRRHFDSELRRMLDLARRSSFPLSLLLADVDRFKAFNDEHGHSAGDDVLRRVAVLLRDGVRSHDLAARHGGEEFAVLLPATSGLGAARAADRIRKAIAGAPWDHRPITACFGIATALPAEPMDTEILFARAVEALDRAKQSGRNRVCRHEVAARLRVRPVGPDLNVEPPVSADRPSTLLPAGPARGQNGVAGLPPGPARIGSMAGEGGHGEVDDVPR